MHQNSKLGTLGHAPQALKDKHGDFVPMKLDPKNTTQPGFRGLTSKGHHAMIKHGIGRGTINRRGG